MAEETEKKKKSAQDIIATADQLKSEKTTWEARWQEVMDYLLPRKSDIIRMTIGPKTTTQIFDSTGAEANQVFAAGMFGHLCPATSRWMQIEPADEDLKKSKNVMGWCVKASEAIIYALANSNFGQEITESFLNHGSIGTDNLYLEPDRSLGSNLVFQNLPISEMLIMENYQGIVDAHYRLFKLNPRQALQWFGKENLSADILKSAEDPKKKLEKFDFIHCVEPREEYDSTKVDNENKPFASYIIEVKSKTMVREGGYFENPFITSRFLKTQGESYGWSPGIQVLPEIKGANAWKRILLAAGEKVVDPALQLPNDGFVLPIKTQPGGLNYYMPQAKDSRIEPIKTGGDLPAGFEVLEDFRRTIKRAFYNDLFIILEQESKIPKTATEILERSEERILLLVFYLGRLEYELFQQLAIRVLGILLRAKKIDNPPEELRRTGGFKVVMTSKLAQRIKKAEVAGFRDVLQMGLEIAKYTGMNEHFDNMNFDQIFPDLMDMSGCPSRWKNTEAQIKTIRDNRAKAAQAEREQEMLAMAASNAGKLSKRIEENSPLSILGEATGVGE